MKVDALLKAGLDRDQIEHCIQVIGGDTTTLDELSEFLGVPRSTGYLAASVVSREVLGEELILAAPQFSLSSSSFVEERSRSVAQAIERASIMRHLEGLSSDLEALSSEGLLRQA